MAVKKAKQRTIWVYRFRPGAMDEDENRLYIAQRRSAETNWEDLPSAAPCPCEEAKEFLQEYAGNTLRGNFVGDFKTCSN